MEQDVIIRFADAADAEALSEIAEATFRITFAESNTADDMDAFCRTHYSPAIQQSEILDEHMTTVLVEDKDQLCAFAQLRFGSAPDCVQDLNAAEIQRFYVRPEWHGQGIAHRLMEHCFEILRVRRYRTVFLGVWEFNPRAITFYKKYGFAEVGEHVFVVGADRQRDLILARHL